MKITKPKTMFYKYTLSDGSCIFTFKGMIEAALNGALWDNSAGNKKKGENKA